MLYLVHVPVYFLVTQAAARMGLPTAHCDVALAVSTLSAMLSICLALLSFRYFEGPILRFKDRVTVSATSTR